MPWGAILAQFGIFVAADLVPAIDKLFILPVASDLLALAATWIKIQLDPVTIAQMLGNMIANIAKAAHNADPPEDETTIEADQRRATMFLLGDAGAPSGETDITAAIAVAKLMNWQKAGFPTPTSPS